MTFQIGYAKFFDGLPPSRDEAERAGWQAAKAEKRELTPEQRAARFGDTTRDLLAEQRAYEDALIERLQTGLPLSVYDRKRARRLLRERREAA